MSFPMQLHFLRSINSELAKLANAPTGEEKQPSLSLAAPHKKDVQQGQEEIATETRKQVLLLTAGAEVVTKTVETGVKKIAAVKDEFAAVLEELSGLQAYGGFLELSDVLKQLTLALTAREKFRTDPSTPFNARVNPATIEESIQRLVEILVTWGGEAGQKFSLQEFEKRTLRRPPRRRQGTQARRSLGSTSSALSPLSSMTATGQISQG